LKHLCSKLHCQKGFNLVLFSYNIVRYSIEARNLECRLSSDSGHKPRSRSRTWISWMLVFTPHILPPFYHLKWLPPPFYQLNWISAPFNDLVGPLGVI
jgi:hypothetical protein